MREATIHAFSHKQGDMSRIRKVEEMKDGATTTAKMTATMQRQKNISPLLPDKEWTGSLGLFLACTLFNKYELSIFIRYIHDS